MSAVFEQNEDVSVIGEVRMDISSHSSDSTFIIFLTVNGMAHSSGD